LSVFSVRYGIQLIALLGFRSYYMYIMAVLLAQLLSNTLALVITNNMFPDYQPKGELSPGEKRDINEHIRDLFTAKLGGTVTNSADAIVISAFLGLTVLAKYNNYYYILSALFGLYDVSFSVLPGWHRQ
jgi:O-antigen/teichoic acid export membrane protein